MFIIRYIFPKIPIYIYYLFIKVNEVILYILCYILNISLLNWSQRAFPASIKLHISILALEFLSALKKCKINFIPELNMIHLSPSPLSLFFFKLFSLIILNHKYYNGSHLLLVASHLDCCVHYNNNNSPYKCLQILKFNPHLPACR